MYELIIFAGTTEGYEIAGFAGEHRINTCVCVATEYGKTALKEGEYLHLAGGRMDECRMHSFFCEHCPSVVVDATHPYAKEATHNIRKAFDEYSGFQRLSGGEKEPLYIRVLRGSVGSENIPPRGPAEEDRGRVYKSTGNVIYVEDACRAAKYLDGTLGNILVTTGSKELEAFTVLKNYQERLYARVLPLPGIIEECNDLGLCGKHVIGMQGPFTSSMNQAMMEMTGCRYLVTKESGTAGGFIEKLEAAAAANVTAVVIGRPPGEKGVSLYECRRLLSERFGLQLKPEITIVGIGPGSRELLTKEAWEALHEAELLIGAKRMVDAVREPHHDIFYEYNAGKIRDFIDSHREYRSIAIAVSGDTGFFSGASALLKSLPEDTRIVCGISSAAYFMSKVKMTWEDAVFMSAHGRDTDLVPMIAHNRKVFAITGEKDAAAKLASSLTDMGLGDTELTIGENLSYETEKIFTKKASELTGYQGVPLSVILSVNNRYVSGPALHGVKDSSFERGKVPMTKEEIRRISVSRLGLKRDSVCYDIGAGTGSVAVEMALTAEQGRVYAFEKNKEALSLLEINRRKFACSNMVIVPGSAPESMDGLPAPAHAFIGGSGGKMEEIVCALLSKNPDLRLVINCVTLETLTQVMGILEKYGLEDSDVIQMTIARARKAGSYHMMLGENPVYIITTGRKHKA